MAECSKLASEMIEGISDLDRINDKHYHRLLYI